MPEPFIVHFENKLECRQEVAKVLEASRVSVRGFGKETEADKSMIRDALAIVTDTSGSKVAKEFLSQVPVIVLSADLSRARRLLPDNDVKAWIKKGPSDWPDRLRSVIDDLLGVRVLQCRCEFVETVGDRSLCWVEIADGKWVKTEIPNSALDHLHLSHGGQFLWSAANGTARITAFGEEGPLGMMQETLREFDRLSAILHDQGGATEVDNHHK